MTETATTSSPHPCQFCGYDLTGLATGQCPECGRPVERFTDRARAVIAEANKHAMALLREPQRRWWTTPAPRAILPAHVLLGLLTGPHGVGYGAIQSCGVDAEALKARALRVCPRGGGVSLPDDARLPLHPGTKAVVRRAIEEAARLGHDWVGTEHILLSLCRVADPATRRTLWGAGVVDSSVGAFIGANLAAVRSLGTDQRDSGVGR